MDEQKKETLLNQGPESKLCLNCGFPNRNTDSHCLYCQTSLLEDSGIFSWFKQTYYILRWRWQLKQKRDHISPRSRISFFKAAGYFLLGAVLSGLGFYVFMYAISTHSFSKGLIAILFLVYGVFTLKALFSRK